MNAESGQQTRVPVGEFLEETVFPALQARLDTAFPEFSKSDSQAALLSARFRLPM